MSHIDMLVWIIAIKKWPHIKRFLLPKYLTESVDSKENIDYVAPTISVPYLGVIPPLEFLFIYVNIVFEYNIITLIPVSSCRII